MKGKNVVVYEKSGSDLKKLYSGKVNKNGNISFESDHLGKYIISVK